MSTKMTEDDWRVALEVFRSSLPSRGDKGRNNRLFLEALHYFEIHNITWRGQDTLASSAGDRRIAVSR